jgi:hypothetical protein
MASAMRCGHVGGDPRGCLLCFQESESKRPQAQPPPSASMATVEARAQARNLELIAMSRLVARKSDFQARANATPVALLMHPETFPDWERAVGIAVIRSPTVPPGALYLVYDSM